MQSDPIVGVFLHALGGLMSAIFCLPFRYVRHWAWESYWLVGGIFSWIIVPWCCALLTIPDLLAVLRQSPMNSLIATFSFGVLWGIGGLMFGLTVRYLGLALGTAMALGYCAAFGTLLPPLFAGDLPAIVASKSGIGILAGVVICLLGIALMGIAGYRKEWDVSKQARSQFVNEFNFHKGLAVATFCGIMSACMSYAFAAGKPIAATAALHGAAPLWQNIPVLIVVLAGGFVTNLIVCVFLNIRNGTASDYLRQTTSASESETVRSSVPLLSNYVLAGTAGAIWYLQFLFYSMGSSQMGQYDFSSWTLHMASIIVFGTLAGLCLSEWKGATRRTMQLMFLGLGVLVLSTIVIGLSNYFALRPVEPLVEGPVI